MLYAYSNTAQSVAVDSAATFALNNLQTGCTATHLANDSTIYLNKPGVYYITVTAIGTSAIADTNISLSLYKNGVQVPGAVTSGTVVNDNGLIPLTLNAIVRVLPNCCAINTNLPTAITVINTSSAAETLNNITITVTKVG